LLGANRRFIEQHIPHIGSLLRTDLAEVIEQSDLVVVGMAGAEVAHALSKHGRADQPILDLVNIGAGSAHPARVEGLCW
jgi:GDP-mannose 6-dehydrogenase